MRAQEAPVFRNPDLQDLCVMLGEVKTIAVVGLSPKATRPSHRIGRALQGWGYRVIPVRPGLDSVLGEKAYASLRDVPGPVDLVNVFLAAERVPAIVEDCIAIGARRMWLQDGVVSSAAAERAVNAGMTVVMDRCIWRDYIACGQGG